MKNIYVLIAPTASGKSDLAIKIAKEFNMTIINFDSKQVYRDIEIISAQPSKQDLEALEHRLYGFVDPGVNFSFSMWLGYVKKEIEQCEAPLLVGGTGLYIKRLIEGVSNIPDINPNDRLWVKNRREQIGAEEFYRELKLLDKKIDLNINDTHRVLRAYEVAKYTGKSIKDWQKDKKDKIIDANFTILFLDKPRDILYANCQQRFLSFFDDAIEEVKLLKEKFLDPDLPAMKAHGVPELIKYLNGDLTKELAIEKAVQNTRNYIKRQKTWIKHQLEKKISITEDNAIRIIKDIQSNKSLHS